MSSPASSPARAPLTSDAIKARARELGFDACGIAPVAGLPELEFFDEWIARGFAGDMTWLAESAALRADARGALKSARSVIVTATVYNVARPYSTECADPTRAYVARYGWGEDYHRIITSRLDRLIGWMHAACPEPFEACPYVDTGPVQERVYARHAGVGWIGKNCSVINPDLGSWLLLGEILCSLPLAPDQPAFDQCGTCALCLEACPTRAFVSPGVLDARRCISYLTIEHRGAIPDELGPEIGTRVFGCDVCQEVCPFNARPALSSDPAWQPRPIWESDVGTLAARSDAELRAGMRGSAMQRVTVRGLRRNIDIAVANAGKRPAHR